MAALAVVLAAPVSAHTLTLKASVPFEFVVGGHTMPAGDYVFDTLIDGGRDTGYWAVRNASSGTASALTWSSPVERPGQRGEVFLTFHRYGGDYFLAKIWDGSSAAGRAIPMSRTEREKAKSASIGKPEVVMVLARR